LINCHTDTPFFGASLYGLKWVKNKKGYKIPDISRYKPLSFEKYDDNTVALLDDDNKRTQIKPRTLLTFSILTRKHRIERFAQVQSYSMKFFAI